MGDDAFTRKLLSAFELGPDDRLAIERAIGVDPRSSRDRRNLLDEGRRAEGAVLVLEGAACRFKHLSDGRRQIVSFMLPGDICDPRVALLKAVDHSIAPLGPLKIAVLSWSCVTALTSGRAALTRAILWTKQVDESIAREWAVNLGRRTASERIAHLVCELQIRLGRVGLADPGGFRLPMRQTDLADASGLSIVHVNRTLQELRARKLIVLRGRQVAIPDFSALARHAHFCADYLHLGFGLRSEDGAQISP